MTARWAARWLVVAAVLAVGALALPPAETADAGWFSRLVREAGETGGTAARLGAGTLDDAGRYVSKLPKVRGQATLAARRETSGHWTFTNAEGETFTAASQAEMVRVARVLAPAVAAGDARLTLVLTEDTALAASRALDELPNSRLRVLVDRKSYPLAKRAGADGAEALTAQVRRNVHVPLNDKAGFQEAMFQLERAFRPSWVRVLAISDDGPRRLGAVAARNPTTKQLEPDRIAPDVLVDALRKIPRQAVILTGRVEGDKLVYRTASGSERMLELTPLRRAAAESDVDLLVLNARTPRQPGSRNWLWQRAEVDGLETALKRRTFADFLNALGESTGGLTVTTSAGRSGRVNLQAVSAGSARNDGVSGTLETIVAEVVSETAGRVLMMGLEGDVVDRERVKELDRRIIPGVPSYLQIGYLVGLICGVFGWPFARAWWFRIWPPEERADYGRVVGYQLARLVRLIVFVVVFMPVVGVPAAIVNLASQIWSWVTLPFRVLRWIAGLFRSRPA